MTDFPKLSKAEYPTVFLEDTDEHLPTKPDANLRYAFFQTIAKGGKCLVQSCKDLNLNRYICYKSLLPEIADDPVEQQRFIREARVTAMLQHPNTIPTYELSRNQKGHYYFTMKLVHGYTLREILDFRERYDLTQLIDVVIQVAHALEYAHTHGVVHRDIKPENILVGPFGEVLLLDWGLAKVWTKEGKSPIDVMNEVEASQQVHTMTMEGKLQGTISYMSPEQINRDPDIDGRTDIYSLAAVIYEILTGQTAAQGDNIDAILACTLNEEPTPPSKISSIPIPKRLEALTMQCLKKNPDERIQTANELIRLLQEGLLIE